MRLFFMQNELGNRIPLNNETGIFLTEPEGLGLEFGDTFADIGEGFFRMVSKRHNQRVIGGKLNFMKDSYRLYNDFINWCMQAKQLYFIYRPIDVDYYIHVEIESFQKTEINQLGYLEVPIRLKYLSPWYVPTPATISMIGEDITAFTFGTDETPGSYFGDDENDSTDVLIGSSSESYVSEIHPAGHLPPALKITIKGECTNPVIKLVGVETGIEYGKCSINKTFGAGSTIELSTMYEDSYIKSYDILGNETDLLPYVDLTSEPFFKAPLNEVCNLTIADSESLSGQVNGFVYFYYRSI